MTKHLIHIGFMKAGSTFLQTWFESHPQLVFVRRGIAGFQGTHSITHIARTLKTPRYYVTSDEELGAGWTNPSSYLDINAHLTEYGGGVKHYQARVCATLHDLFPTAIILIVTRGYKSMLRAGFSEYLKAGGTLDYPSFLRTFATTHQAGLDPDYLINLYVHAFGEQNLLVLPYELLRDDQARFLGLIQDRLGLQHFEFDPGRVNPSLTPQDLYWYPRISHAVASAGAKLNRRYGTRLYRAYINRIVRQDRLRPLFRILDARPHQVTDDDCPPEFLHIFRNRAERLRHNPLFAPYRTEYLWSDLSAL